MEPAILVGSAVAAVAKYLASKARGIAGRAGQDLDAAVDERLDRLYEMVRGRLAGDERGQRTLEALEAAPDDQRLQGRLEAELEAAVDEDPDFGGALAQLLDELRDRPPATGTSIRDAGPVAGGNVTITAGGDAAGRDLRGG